MGFGCRHCERREAIQNQQKQTGLLRRLRLLAMTVDRTQIHQALVYALMKSGSAMG
jgi:hypothetical protein